MRAAVDEAVQSTLRAHRLDPDTDAERIYTQLARLTQQEQIDLIADVQRRDLKDPRADDQGGTIRAVLDAAQSIWNQRMQPLRDEALRIVREEAPKAMSALDSGDTKGFTAQLTAIEDRVREIGEELRDARNATREVTRDLLRRSTDTFATKDRQALVDSITRQLAVPPIVDEASHAPLDLSRAQLSKEQGLTPDPGLSIVASRNRPGPGGRPGS